ncbi:amidohydrolase family protein [Parapusillimonas granuli]|nr:amidohydrolase family protein [Parapusillimonas granuli]MBB5215640.1 putative TIM-barrel fold metal-dependent hydrolase [Parapusillimonas granuli]
MIVDAHHHLYVRPGVTYLLDNLISDIRESGHDVRATVYMQARSMYRSHGPNAFRPVGETEFANGVAAMSASGIYGKEYVCSGIVGFADLMLGDGVRPVLEAHIGVCGGRTSSGGRFCGIRHPSAWDMDTRLCNPAYPSSEDMMRSKAFRAGFMHLDRLELTFDAWLYFHQIPRIMALADAFPNVPIAVNHCGGVLGISAYANQREAVFDYWRTQLQFLSLRPNVMMKLGGLGMEISGFGFESADKAPNSLALARAWRPWIETCIELFGPKRCMFESNFPADKVSYGYGIGWNAFKRIVSSATPDEKDELFWRTAMGFYHLPLNEALQPLGTHDITLKPQ